MAFSLTLQRYILTNARISFLTESIHLCLLESSATPLPSGLPFMKTYFPSYFGKGGFALLNFISCSVGCSKYLIMFSLYSVENGAFNEWLAQRTGKGSTHKSLLLGDGWVSDTWSQAPGAGSVWDTGLVYWSLLILQWGNWGPGVSARLCPFSLVHAYICD